ncbi:MAG: hypothetical protein AAFQ37_04755 [Bacteroidota bacterium]
MHPSISSKEFRTEKRLFGLLLCVCLSMVNNLEAQNVESIGPGLRQFTQPRIGVNGGINLATNFYTASSIDPRRDQFQWMANINLNLALGPINAPFSLTFADGNEQFNLPSYTFTGISPTYKWATLHAGDRSMFFSRYTMSGINFRGVGLELTPGKFLFKGMYGRLNRAVAEDLNARQMLNPSYERTGYGFSAGYEIPGLSINTILFGANDDETSITDPLNSDITPAQNLVASISAKKAFSNKVLLDAEFARSALNEDRRTNQALDEFSGVGNRFLGLFTPTETAVYGNAFNSGVTLNQKTYSLRLGYEQIDRGFRTLGTIFFNRDLVHYTGTLSTRLFKNKVSLALRGGLETTNRQDLTKPTNDRVVASVNATYNPSSRLVFNGSFSNFENSTKIRARENPAVFVDSLFLAQLTQSFTFSSSYNLREKFNPTTLTLVYSHQSANSVQDDIVIQDAKSRFNNASLIFNQRITEADLNWTASINYNLSNFGDISTTTVSPTLMFNKLFFARKLSSNLRLTYNAVSVEGGNNSTVLNAAWSNSWAFTKTQNIGLTLNFINRGGTEGEGLGDFSELYGRILYNYQFNASIGKPKTGDQ